MTVIGPPFDSLPLLEWKLGVPRELLPAFVGQAEWSQCVACGDLMCAPMLAMPEDLLAIRVAHALKCQPREVHPRG